MKFNSKFEILSPEGFVPFKGIRKSSRPFHHVITLTSGEKIKASSGHKFVSVETGEHLYVYDLKPGDKICGVDGLMFEVESIVKVDSPIDLYDAVDVGSSHQYITNDIISFNCDCDFLSSGDTTFESEDMNFYERNMMTDPVECRGIGKDLWIWKYADYSKNYLVSADVARGDGQDFSAFHVWDVESCEQVAEFRGQMPPREYAHLLMNVATEYNNAILAVENANIGWSTIEEIIAKGYPNLYYGDGSTLDTVESYSNKMDKGKLTPGFTTSVKTRPLVIAKLYDYVRHKAIIIHSKRLMSEMRTFVWKNGKAQAAQGYHDDLIMSCGIGVFIRDTALKLRMQSIDLSRAQVSTLTSMNNRGPEIISSRPAINPFQVTDIHGNQQDVSWLLK